MHLAAELGEPCSDEIRGALLGKGELRVRVDIASNGSQLVMVVEHFGNDRHLTAPGSRITQPMTITGRAIWRQPRAEL